MAEIEYQVDEMLFKMNALAGTSNLPEKPPIYFTDSDGTYGLGEDAISTGSEVLFSFLPEFGRPLECDFFIQGTIFLPSSIIQGTIFLLSGVNTPSSVFSRLEKMPFPPDPRYSFPPFHGS